jgi:hypothetical protein
VKITYESSTTGPSTAARWTSFVLPAPPIEGRASRFVTVMDA